MQGCIITEFHYTFSRKEMKAIKQAFMCADILNAACSLSGEVGEAVTSLVRDYTDGCIPDTEAFDFMEDTWGEMQAEMLDADFDPDNL